MLLYHDGARQRQALTRAAANFFGREKRIKHSFAEFFRNAVTQIVNAHGALIQLREAVLIGQKIRITNVSTNEEIDCIVVDITKGNTIPEVGLAFVDPAQHFWRVSFPSADWSPRSPEAKRYSSDHDLSSPSMRHK